MKYSKHPTVLEVWFWSLALVFGYWLAATMINAHHTSVRARYEDLPFEMMTDYWDRKKTTPCAVGIAEVYDDRLNPDCSRKRAQ